jgi:3-hydroxyacyl-CoA dehydrogenase/enoyl-CoA hydratase/3-hydroxybutyryl-CoA epimerase
MKHWHPITDKDGIVWLGLKTANPGLNTLSKEVLEEFASLLDGFDQTPPTGVIIHSEKESGFIAGADIEEFTTLDTAEKATELVARGWHLMNRLAAVRYPTLALIRGVCLGGGLELSLACRYRIAVDTPATRLGLPEVLLGIVPGWGGMHRLPKVVGPQAALDMMLTAKSVDARRAKRMGLVDMAVPPRLMNRSARMMVTSGRPPKRASGLAALLNQPIARPFIAAMARRQVAKRASRRHYPAPYAIIDLWQKTDGDPLRAPELLDQIVRSPTARNLVRVFFLQERLKGFGKTSESKIQHVHVIGSGVMGGDIAAWCALRGMRVTLQDQTMERIQPALSRANSLFQKRVRDTLKRRDVTDRLIPDPQGFGVDHADLVIEAIFEDLDAKHALLQSLEPRLKPGAILATNTSSLRIEDLRSVLQDPSRLVGIHFFNPVAQMPLVEVISAEGTSPQAVATAFAFVRAIDKLPLPVKSAPGFLVNAVLAPYMLAAMRAVDEGLSPAQIDAAMRDFGMPLGPLELVDTVGLDIAMAAGKALAADGTSPPRCLVSKVEQGHLGKKTGQGFYRWENGRITTPISAAPGPVGLADKLIMPLVQQTQRLVENGVVADADLADAGVIFGTGFAPFRGGPLHWQSTMK